MPGCVTSEGCDDGSRCDAGQCVKDDACAGESRVELLLESKNEDPAHSTDGLYVVRERGREYLTGRRARGETELVFRELATDQRSTLAHEPGLVDCIDDPLWCLVRTNGNLHVLADLSLSSDGSTWRAGRDWSWPLAPEDYLSITDQHRAFITHVGDAGSTVQWFDLEDGATLASLSFVGTLRAVVREGAETPVYVVYEVEAGIDVEYYAKRFADEEPPTLLYKGSPVTSFEAYRQDDAWYVVHARNEQSPTLVERVVDGAATPLSTLPNIVAMNIEPQYQVGQWRLEPDASVYTLQCFAAACRTTLLKLQTGVETPVGQVSLPTGMANLVISKERRLGCGARDLIVGSPNNTGQYDYYSVRVPGQPGLP